MEPTQDIPPESDRNQQEYPEDPARVWMWLAAAAAFAVLLWGLGSWYGPYSEGQRGDSPFSQVTNRQFSLFLWQHPEFMRVNTRVKSGYPSGVARASRGGVGPEKAEDYVMVEAELLFRYHVWDRLLSQERFPRRIPAAEFATFLQEVPMWHPRHWQQALAAYVELVGSLPERGDEDLAPLPETSLPYEVRQAFVGWKNYYQESILINELQVTFAQVEAFLRQHPHYARNYWRNIVNDTVPDYLRVLSSDDRQPDDPFPPYQLTPFLKVALFNELHRDS